MFCVQTHTKSLIESPMIQVPLDDLLNNLFSICRRYIGILKSKFNFFTLLLVTIHVSIIWAGNGRPQGSVDENNAFSCTVLHKVYAIIHMCYK